MTKKKTVTKNASEAGSVLGTRRAEKLTAVKRHEIACKAAAARKLAAAYTAHILGLESIDHVHKKYVDPIKTISPAWVEFARLTRKIHDAWASSLPRGLPVPHPSRPYLTHRKVKQLDNS